MWHSVDFLRLGFERLPIELRKPFYAAFLAVIFKPLNALYYAWSQFRSRNIYKMQHTGQVCYLRGALNDQFDPLERRIYIGEGVEFNITYIYTEGEAIDVNVHTQTENIPLWLRTEAETTGTGADFIVWVPESVYATQIPALKAMIDFYKAGGKRYTIMVIQ